MKGIKGTKRVRRWIAVAGIFAVWYVISKTGIFNPYVLPSPGRVLGTLGKMMQSSEIFVDIGISFRRVFHGFFIAFIIAFGLGTVGVFTPKIAESLEYVLEFLRNVPPLSMIPLLILWCGIGETTKVLIIILAAFFPMYLNIMKGFNGCDRRLLEVGEVFGYGRIKRFSKIILPYASIDILVGMRIGMGYSWRAIIGAEMVAASTGLGHMILFAQQMSRTDKVIAGILVIGVVGIVTDKLFGLCMKRLWGGTSWNEQN